MRRLPFFGIMAVGLVAGFLWLGTIPAWAQSGVPPGQAGAAGPAVTGTCKATKISFATGETTGLSTTSTAYVAMPDMSVTFKIGGTATVCVKVEFSAFVFAALDRLIFVRALMDGATVGSPSEVQFSGDDDEEGDGKWARSHAFNFAFPTVAPGTHTIIIQWKSFDGGTVFVHKRSMFVHHK